MTATDATDATTARRAPTPDDALRIADSDDSGPLLAADGTPLKVSLARALRREKLRALALIAPLLLFVLITFVAPIADMLFRSVENSIVPETLPRTTAALDGWDPGSGELPDEHVFQALGFDMMVAAERKNHTRLGSRLNYETNGISSLFRSSGRNVDDIGEGLADQFVALNPAWEEQSTWVALMASDDWIAEQADWAATGGDEAGPEPAFDLRADIADVLPRTADIYLDFARTIQVEDEDSPTEEEPWNVVYLALYNDLMANRDAASALEGDSARFVAAAAEAVDGFQPEDVKAAFLEIDEEWGDLAVWQTIDLYSGYYTSGYFLSALDMQLTPDGIEAKPDLESIYVTLFWRTLVLSVTITSTCLLLGYPIAWLLSNLPDRKANLLLILVLLPFWTSLLVRTSSWIVLLQQQGVVNDTLVALGIIGDNNRLEMMFNEVGTVVAMTHILLPFMILPLFSVMKTISPNYLRAAKSLGATNWTAFWRVYFPQTIPGIGAGAILVFILSIGYYITPELVGGTSGIFISNRIAYHISSSLNWGLAAALGVILLSAVLVLYWAYDRIVGIDNVKLG